MNKFLEKIGLGNIITLIIIIMGVGIAWGTTTLKLETVTQSLMQEIEINKEDHSDFVTRRELELYIDRLEAQYDSIQETQRRILNKLDDLYR